MPGRMPSDREVQEMIGNAEWLKTMLEHLRHMVHEVNEGRLGNSSSGNGSGSGSSTSGRQKNIDDMEPMYNDQGNKPYGMEVKKRRGVSFFVPPYFFFLLTLYIFTLHLSLFRNA